MRPWRGWHDVGMQGGADRSAPHSRWRRGALATTVAVGALAAVAIAAVAMIRSTATPATGPLAVLADSLDGAGPTASYAGTLVLEDGCVMVRPVDEPPAILVFDPADVEWDDGVLVHRGRRIEMGRNVSLGGGNLPLEYPLERRIPAGCPSDFRQFLTTSVHPGGFA